MFIEFSFVEAAHHRSYAARSITQFQVNSGVRTSNAFEILHGGLKLPVLGQRQVKQRMA